MHTKVHSWDEADLGAQAQKQNKKHGQFNFTEAGGGEEE